MVVSEFGVDALIGKRALGYASLPACSLGEAPPLLLNAPYATTASWKRCAPRLSPITVAIAKSFYSPRFYVTIDLWNSGRLLATRRPDLLVLQTHHR
jgi:hypothetical protein